MTDATFVLIPGHLCDERLYAPQRPLLESRGPVRCADTRRDDDLAAITDRLLADHPGPLALVGLSMGGMIAMEAVARAPERILGAALLDTDPTAARDKEIAWRAGMREKVAETGLAAYVEPFVGSFYRHAPERCADLATATREMMLETPLDVFERQARALDARNERRAETIAFPRPLAVIWGAQDRVCPPVVHQEIAAAPAAVATEIPDCGHIATLEKPDAVNAALEAWLARL